jgi:hypothetical protein
MERHPNSPLFDLLTIVKDNTVHFVKYKQGYAYYRVWVACGNTAESANMLIFPVPLSDIGDASLFAEDKAIIFMRYIRKALEEGTFLMYNGI